MPVPVWVSPLFLAFPIFWLSPLAIPPLMVIIVSSYVSRKLVLRAYPPPPKSPASTSSRRTFRAWKRMHSPILPNPSTEITRVIGARFTLVVDSISAGTTTMPFDSQVGGQDAKDIAYNARFNMTGTSAQTVLQHGSNTLVLTVQFLAKGLLYQQDVTRTLTLHILPQDSALRRLYWSFDEGSLNV